VLRSTTGDKIQLFDAAGRTADAIIETLDRDGVTVRVEAIREADVGVLELTVAAAVPRPTGGLDVEKLRRARRHPMGAAQTARSVVHRHHAGPLRLFGCLDGDSPPAVEFASPAGWTTLRAVLSGTHRVTPSSLSFSTIQSARSPWHGGGDSELQDAYVRFSNGLDSDGHAIAVERLNNSHPPSGRAASKSWILSPVVDRSTSSDVVRLGRIEPKRAGS